MKVCASYQDQCWQTVLCSEIANFLNPQTVSNNLNKPNMNDENFEKIMTEHSDERLIDVLKNRNEYQEKAVEAAIKEAIKRNLILDSNELDSKFPISDKEQEKIKKELSLFGKKIDFQKSTTVLYMIGIGTGLSIGILLRSVPIIPIVYLGLVFYCSKYYNNTLANVIIWIAAFEIVAVILYIISLFIQLLI